MKASINAAQNIRGQVGVMVAEVSDALEYDKDRLTSFAALEAEIGALAKTVTHLGERAALMVQDQQGRVNTMTAKHKALSEELEAIDRIIAKLETEVGK